MEKAPPAANGKAARKAAGKGSKVQRAGIKGCVEGVAGDALVLLVVHDYSLASSATLAAECAGVSSQAGLEGRKGSR